MGKVFWTQVKAEEQDVKLKVSENFLVWGKYKTPFKLSQPSSSPCILQGETDQFCLTALATGTLQMLL